MAYSQTLTRIISIFRSFSLITFGCTNYSFKNSQHIEVIQQFVFQYGTYTKHQTHWQFTFIEF